MSIDSLRDTIAPKSNQLNADDLIAGPQTIKITAVKRGNAEQPVTIEWEGGAGRPYYPCKSMRRVMIHAWGDNGNAWVGQSVTLYCDPSVKFGGVQVGGIRISHMTGIERTLDIALTATRGKRTPYRVEPLRVTYYPDEKFKAELPKMIASLDSGKATAEQIIAFCNKTAPLSKEQIALIVPTPKQDAPKEEEKF